MTKITKVKTANYDEWKKLRNRYIGGSDAAAVVGLNPYSSPYTLWAQKLGCLPDFQGNLATEIGTYLEDFVAAKFEAETGKKARRCNQSFLNSQYPWAIANIDREIVGEDAGLEIKTTDSLNMKKFKNGEYPASYYVQCVHYMAVTGKKRWYLAVLIGNKEFKWFTIDRDEAEIAALMGAEKELWLHIKNGTPPAVDGTKPTTDSIKAIYTDSNDENIDLYLHSSDLAKYVEFKNKIKQLETMQNEIANRVKVFMGKAGSGECDNYRVSWKTSERSTFDSKRFAKENPDINLSDYYKTNSYRTFKVTETK